MSARARALVLVAGCIFAAPTSAAPAPVPTTTEEGGDLGWVQLARHEVGQLFREKQVTHLVERQPFQLYDVQPTEPILSPDGGQLYVGTSNGELRSMSALTGQTLWVRSDCASSGRSMSLYRDLLIVGNETSLVALDRLTGADRWRVEIGGLVSAEMSLTGTVAIVAVEPDAVVAVDLAKGEQLWRFKRPRGEEISVFGHAPATIDLPRGQAYAGFSDGSVAALGLEKGEVRWLVELESSGGGIFADVDARPVLSDDGETLWVAGYRAGLFALDPENGRTRWKNERRLRLTGLEWVNGLLIASHANGQVLGLDARDGAVRWRFRYRRGVPTRPRVLAPHLVAVSASGGHALLLDTRTGQPRQVIALAPHGSVDPPSLGGDRLAVLTTRGTLILLDAQPGALR